jgi:predicted GTPase
MTDIKQTKEKTLERPPLLILPEMKKPTEQNDKYREYIENLLKSGIFVPNKWDKLGTGKLD